MIASGEVRQGRWRDKGLRERGREEGGKGGNKRRYMYLSHLNFTLDQF